MPDNSTKAGSEFRPMTDETDRLYDIAQIVTGLTYADMMHLACSLRETYDDFPSDLDSPEGWAEILHAWAKLNVETRHD